LRICILLLAFVSSTLCVSQELPPIQNFAPPEYHGENQNWDISQAKDKVIYIANSKGLLAYNGANWMLFPVPNESIIRAVHVVDDVVYTGSYMEFGYWLKDDYGMLQYTSLSQKWEGNLLPDEEFWNILDMENYIVFQSLSRIYIYNLKDGSFNYIESDTSLLKVFNLDQHIYFQRQSKGIYKIENGKEVLVYDQEPFRNDEVINMFQKEGALLILTKHNGFYRIQDGSIEQWATGADELLSQLSIYSAIQLEDKGYALGTISHGMIHLDQEGQLLYHIDQIKGLRNNTVLSLFEDTDNNIWLGLDNGISYLNLKSPFRVYKDTKGVVGSVYAAVRYDDQLYLGTNQGLYYKRSNNEADYALVEGTQGQVWSLEVIGETLFCGHHLGTFTIEGNKAKKIANTQGTWRVSAFNGNPNRLLQGNYDGLYVLEKLDGKWQVKNKLQGFDHSARFFEELDGEIFVNHEYKGLFRVKADSAFLKAEAVSIDTLLRGGNSGLAKYKGDLLYAYRKGIFKYDRASEEFIRDSLLSKGYTDSEYLSGKMVVDVKDNRLWLFTNSEITYLTEGNLDGNPVKRSIPLPADMRAGIIGYESVTALEGVGRYLFGTSNGFITVSIEDFEDKPFSVHIESIRKADRNISIGKSSQLRKNGEGTLSTDENNLEITCYVAEYNKYLKPDYQFQLLGIYDEWSPWTAQPSVSFENLPPGTYTFNVRARIGKSMSNNTATYSFTIARPWYLSTFSLVIYFLTAILGAILIHMAYRRHYHQRQELLIRRNTREIALAKAENEKEIIRIKNKHLKKEFKNKSNELAAATLSIIKKNELLSRVKEQLLSNVEEKDSVKAIITVIDKSLKQQDDWELFKEAFNNADREFLKKLKKAHPNLSPNDIRLCAYLRLNLSSKEIAPLLNISVRSVEIKRYRLRKKMNLSHDANLVDYILTL
jgi:DNA-binding CsgD family transcriptional regulator